MINCDITKTTYDEDKIPRGHYMIIGPTGCGKTNMLLNLLFKYLDIGRVQIITNTPNQEKYEFMSRLFDVVNGADYCTKEGVRCVVREIDDMCSGNEELAKMLKQFFNRIFQQDLVGHEKEFDFSITSPEELGYPIQQDFKHSIVVFDDIRFDAKELSKVRNYFSFGRNCGHRCIFLCQTYYGIDKDIRRNCNVFILFKGIENRDIKLIGEQHKHPDLEQRYISETQKPFSFMTFNRYHPTKAYFMR